MSGDAVCVVLPVRDEAATVAATLESLVAQTLPAEQIEVLVFDGLSTDNTLAVCERFRERRPWRRFSVERISSASCRTRSTRRSSGPRPRSSPAWTADRAEPWVPAALHGARQGGRPHDRGGRPPRRRSRRSRRELDRRRGYASLGVGQGVPHPSQGPRRGPHHPFAVWRTDFVREAGGFDAGLARNQDDEFSMRAARHGARIEVVDGEFVLYRPRERFRGLGSQYLQYGLWKAAVARRKGLFPLRSLAPAAVVRRRVRGRRALAARGRPRPAAAYLAAYAAGGAVAARARRGASWPLVGSALITVHGAYGAGLLLGAAYPELTETSAGRGRVR